MEFNSNGYNGWYCAHCRCGVDPSEVTYHETHTVCGRYITDDEPPKGLSDLEIVQKALIKTESKLIVFDFGIVCEIWAKNWAKESYLLHRCYFNELLTWAKQTIEGVE